ncbi:PBSX family phage terminase large subunit [Lactococcus petauri]|uniref:PBSX family phage terminase large subunit n=1 Tax=Lactococcus petauri TaxID=1940789 RepID=UPI0038544531
MSNEIEVNYNDLIAPPFRPISQDILADGHKHYWLNGGRGSTKSSFVSLEVVSGMMDNRDYNAVVIRKTENGIGDTVFAQYLWAIDALGVGHLWKETKSPYKLTYLPLGNSIVFKGLDKPRKLKSTKFRHGYAKYIHFEEVDELRSMAEIRNVNQSLARGGANQMFFYTYNPPKSITNWVNGHVQTQVGRKNTLIHSSTYLDVPPEWLGDTFIEEAEYLKEVNQKVYEHEYLGIVTGTGAEVFPNVKARTITKEEYDSFDKIHRGLDFGFAADPLAYVATYYDNPRKRLFFLDEIYQTRLGNDEAVRKIKNLNPLNEPVFADSAEPRTIGEFKNMGLNIRPARKGRGSIEHGIKWLQDLSEIVIDPKRTPNVLREFSGYELEEDKWGNLKGSYPDKDNHSIDATRYALEQLSKPGGMSVFKE